MKESRVQTNIKNALTRVGARVFNVHGHLMQEPGWPDLLVWHRQGFFAIELKIEQGRLRPEQRLILDDLSARGFNAMVLRWFPGHILLKDNGDQLSWDGKDGLSLLRFLKG